MLWSIWNCQQMRLIMPIELGGLGEQEGETQSLRSYNFPPYCISLHAFIKIAPIFQRGLRGSLWCRSGAVISLAEPKEEFVVKKLARRLDIDIPLREVTHGGFRAPFQSDRAIKAPQAGIAVKERQ